jgi:hypothetical protein
MFLSHTFQSPHCNGSNSKGDKNNDSPLLITKNSLFGRSPTYNFSNRNHKGSGENSVAPRRTTSYRGNGTDSKNKEKLLSRNIKGEKQKKSTRFNSKEFNKTGRKVSHKNQFSVERKNRNFKQQNEYFERNDESLKRLNSLITDHY